MFNIFMKDGHEEKFQASFLNYPSNEILKSIMDSFYYQFPQLKKENLCLFIINDDNEYTYYDYKELVKLISSF
jgi:hypothetical protein